MNFIDREFLVSRESEAPPTGVGGLSIAYGAERNPAPKAMRTNLHPPTESAVFWCWGKTYQAKPRQISKQVGVLSFVSLILHVIWENTQAPLFQGYSSFTQHFSICFIGTVGDVIFTLFVYLLISLLKRDLLWITHLNKYDMLVLAIIGFFSAVAIEQGALLWEKWSYAESMPMLPYLGVGFTPVLQMALLLPLSMYLTKHLFHAYESK